MVSACELAQEPFLAVVLDVPLLLACRRGDMEVFSAC